MIQHATYKNNMLKVAVYLIIACPFTHLHSASDHNIPQKQITLRPATFMEGLAIGSITGAGEVLATGQILTAFKNAQQQSRKIPTSFKEYYRGLNVNLICMIPNTALTIASNNVLLQGFKQNFGDSRPEVQKIAAASFAGGLASIVSGPTELLIVQQQNLRKSLMPTLQHILNERGILAFSRGLKETALRDAGFAAGLLWAMPHARAYFSSIIDNDILARISAGVTAGIPTTYATQWIDTIATCHKGDLDKAHYRSMRSTISYFYRTSRLTHLITGGIVPRGLRVICAVTTMDGMQEWLTKHIVKSSTI